MSRGSCHYYLPADLVETCGVLYAPDQLHQNLPIDIFLESTIAPDSPEEILQPPVGLGSRQAALYYEITSVQQ